MSAVVASWSVVPALPAAAVALVLAAAVRALAESRRRAARRRLAPVPTVVARRGPGAALAEALVPPVPRRVAMRMERAGLPVAHADRAWRVATALVVAAVAAAAAAGGPGAAALVVLGGGAAVLLVSAAVGDRASALVDRELPTILATIAAGVRSGASLSLAVAEGAARARGPLRDDLAKVVESTRTGGTLVGALEQWGRHRPSPGARMAGAALALAAETGGAGARTIDGVAATLRDRLAVDRELAALSSQARASAVVIGAAPLAFVALTATSDPGTWDFFLHAPAGLACLAMGGVLDAVGAGWMLRIARAAR